jgi:hypothetical protein
MIVSCYFSIGPCVFVMSDNSCLITACVWMNVVYTVSTCVAASSCRHHSTADSKCAVCVKRVFHIDTYTSIEEWTLLWYQRSNNVIQEGRCVMKLGHFLSGISGMYFDVPRTGRIGGARCDNSQWMKVHPMGIRIAFFDCFCQRHNQRESKSLNKRVKGIDTSSITGWRKQEFISTIFSLEIS